MKDIGSVTVVPDAAEKEIVEVAVLLAPGQLAALEAEAHRRGLTAARLARRLITAFLQSPDTLPDAEREKQV
jgi:hypothetical protein